MTTPRSAAPASVDIDHHVRSLWRLGQLAAVTWLLYVVITLSDRSLHVVDSGGHSLLVLLALFAGAFVIYLMAIRLALRAPQGRPLLVLIIGTGVLFRVTMLFSNPIEEIDLYRYLWDGAVVTQGVSPFRYSPQQVLAASADTELPDDLARLVRLRDSSIEMTEILKRIHFGELPTIYPPVGQAAFALCAWCTPTGASLFTRLVFMKALFVACDLATLLVVIRMLRFTGQPMGLSLTYGWCPLLIKEVANSGHVDALAFLLTTIAACLTLQALYAPEPLRSPRTTASSASALLALAVGAKLYSLILAPLLFISIGRRVGWQGLLLPVVVFAIIVCLLAWPMWPVESPIVAFDTATVTFLGTDTPPVPPQEVGTGPRDPSQSLRAFLSEWEMNDFLFLLVIENLRPTEGLPRGEVAWFSVAPDDWRSTLTLLASEQLGVDTDRAPFLLARALTSVVFLCLAAWLAWSAARARTAAEWLEAAFLTVAWFWLLLPTQNPWYWTWALPFLPFAGSRLWRAMSCLALLYYFRFWLMHQYPDTVVLGTVYTGPRFFDYVVTWIEFGPWLVALVVNSIRR